MRRLLATSLCLLWMAQGGQQSVVVPIQNPSFETVLSPPGYPSDSCGLRGPSVSGWQIGAGSGVFQPTNLNTCGIALPPDGATVAIAGYGSKFSQTLSTTPSQLQEYRPGYASDGVYTLKFSVANYFPTYPGYYEAKVSFGTQELCETSGWGARTFTQVTLVCPASAYIVIDKSLPGGGLVQGKSNLAVTFTAPGWTLLFDNVSLSFTPN